MGKNIFIEVRDFKDDMQQTSHYVFLVCPTPQ